MLSDWSVFACEEDCRFIGTGAALLTSALIGAGASAVEGAVQSKQTSKAVNAQTDASNQAIENLKPFQDTGTKAFTTLGALMGLGGSKGAQVQTQAGLPGPAPTNHLTGPYGGGALSDPSVLGGNSAQAPGGGGALMGTPGQVATQQAASSYPSYGPKTSPVPMVTVTSPDGKETQQVPADQASYWAQKGATIHG